MRQVRALLCLVLALALGSIAVAQDYPAHGDVYVNDFADILTNTEQGRIRQDLIRLFDQTGIEAVVVTLGTMRTYGHDGQIEPLRPAFSTTGGSGMPRLTPA